MFIGVDPLHQVILVSEGVRHTPQAMACHLLDHHATSTPVDQEGKTGFGINITLLCSLLAHS